MQKIAILYDASQAVLSTFDLDEVLRQILAIAGDYFHLKNVAILLFDPSDQKLHVRTQIGWDEGQEEIPMGLGEGITGTAAKLKRPIYAPDVSKDPRYLPSSQLTRSEVAIPLMVGDQVVGVLDCQSDRLDSFDPETIDLLTLFSTQASMALQNAKLYSLEQRRAMQLEAINAIAKQTTAVLDLKDLLDKVCSLVLEAFAVDHVSVLLKDQDALVMRAHRGRLTPAITDDEQLPNNTGLWSEAFHSGKTVAQGKAAPGSVETFKESQSRMCIPLISFGQTVGVLVLDSKREDAFNPADASPLESVADICATAIQNAHYVERVRHLANIDGLTGIFNRRYFEKQIADELERSRRYDTELTVVMVDIDHFKRLNDEFGHLLGDEVLRQVSSIFSQQLRKNDVVCRYGGEEFAILLPQTNFQQAQAVAEKLRKVVEAWQFPGVPRPVTISSGVASCPAHGATRDDVVKAADAALYTAKQSGRNCVVTAPLERAAIARSPA